MLCTQNTRIYTKNKRALVSQPRLARTEAKYGNSSISRQLNVNKYQGQLNGIILAEKLMLSNRKRTQTNKTHWKD